jgi:hypothetical protein
MTLGNMRKLRVCGFELIVGSERNHSDGASRRLAPETNAGADDLLAWGSE